MRRALLLLCVLLPLSAARADAVTIRDLIELSRAGLSDEVLLALIEVDRSVLPVDAESLKALKEAGVSDAVMLAVIRSGRGPVAPALEPLPVSTEPAPVQTDPAPPPAAQVVVIDHQDAPVQQFVPVAVPVFVPVVPARQHRRVDCRDVQPVYWGFGGKLRPDAWTPPRVSRHCR